MDDVRFYEGDRAFGDAAAIRQKVFVEEQGFHNEFDDTDREALHAVLYHGEEAIATARAFRTKDCGSYTIGRVAVVKKARGTGAGRAVMLALEEKLAQLGAKTLELSAQTQATGFYERLGYEAFGEIYYDEHCPHQPMKKILG